MLGSHNANLEDDDYEDDNVSISLCLLLSVSPLRCHFGMQNTASSVSVAGE